MNIEMKTSHGLIVLELYSDKAPKTVENFVRYVEEEHYNGTVFHRVINGFMIQGGGFLPGMTEKPTAHPPVVNEAATGLLNEPYTIAMARTSDPHSASAQFFINVKNNQFLNYSAPTRTGWGYCVFGRVIEGSAVVDAIKAVATGSRLGFDDVPKEDVLIISAKVLSA